VSRKRNGELATRADRENLQSVDEEASPRLEANRRSVSTTDPAAKWTCAPGGPAFFASSANYLADSTGARVHKSSRNKAAPSGLLLQ
jgi:hypothetical protein